MKSKYWIAFSSIEQIDSNFIQKLFEHFGDIEIVSYEDKVLKVKLLRDESLPKRAMLSYVIPCYKG